MNDFYILDASPVTGVRKLKLEKLSKAKKENKTIFVRNKSLLKANREKLIEISQEISVELHSFLSHTFHYIIIYQVYLFSVIAISLTP